MPPFRILVRVNGKTIVIGRKYWGHSTLDDAEKSDGQNDCRLIPFCASHECNFSSVISSLKITWQTKNSQQLNRSEHLAFVCFYFCLSWAFIQCCAVWHSYVMRFICFLFTSCAKYLFFNLSNQSFIFTQYRTICCSNNNNNHNHNLYSTLRWLLFPWFFFAFFFCSIFFSHFLTQSKIHTHTH